MTKYISIQNQPESDVSHQSCNEGRMGSKDNYPQKIANSDEHLIITEGNDFFKVCRGNVGKQNEENEQGYSYVYFRKNKVKCLIIVSQIKGKVVELNI